MNSWGKKITTHPHLFRAVTDIFFADGSTVIIIIFVEPKN